MSKIVDNMDASKRAPGRPRLTKDERRPKLRYSMWFLIIVSNKHDSPEVRENFKKVIKEIFDHRTLAQGQVYIKGTPEEMIINGAFEVGQKHKYPHAHLMIKAKHRGKLSFGFPEIKRRVAEAVGKTFI